MFQFLEIIQCSVNPANAGPINTQDLNLVNTVPADGLAPIGARPSAGAVMTTKLHMFSMKFPLLLLLLTKWHHYKMTNRILLLLVH